jgi:hypothetical protein
MYPTLTPRTDDGRTVSGDRLPQLVELIEKPARLGKQFKVRPRAVELRDHRRPELAAPAARGEVSRRWHLHDAPAQRNSGTARVLS